MIIIEFYLHFHTNILRCSKQDYELGSGSSSAYPQNISIHLYQPHYSVDRVANRRFHLAFLTSFKRQ